MSGGEILEVAQRSPEWYAARCGSLGASDIHDVIAKTQKGNPTSSRANRMATIILERLTGKPADSYQSKAMQEGIENEPLARAAYCFRTDAILREIGLVKHPKIERTHASVDALIADDGILEIKCPQPAQHLSTLLGEPIADKYMAQMQWGMRCAGRQFADFVSFSPAFPEHMKLFVQRVPRDDGRIAHIEGEVKQFLAEVEEKLQQLKVQYPEP